MVPLNGMEGGQGDPPKGKEGCHFDTTFSASRPCPGQPLARGGVQNEPPLWVAL